MRLPWQGVLCISARLLLSLPLRLRTCVFVAVCEGAPPALPSNTWPTACTGAAVGTTCQGVCDTAVGTVAPVAACTSKQTGWVVVSGSCVAARCSGPLPVVENAVWDPTCTANSGSPVGEYGGVQLEQPACVSLQPACASELDITAACMSGCMHTSSSALVRHPAHTCHPPFGHKVVPAIVTGRGAHTLPLYHSHLGSFVVCCSSARLPGTICGATCTAPTTPSVPITSTCTAGAAGTADWSTTAAAAFCGVLRTEVRNCGQGVLLAAAVLTLPRQAAADLSAPEPCALHVGSAVVM